jgi:hypothetical protein
LLWSILAGGCVITRRHSRWRSSGR